MNVFGKMKTAVVCLFALMLAAMPGVLAERTYRMWNDEVKLYSPREKDWTYVTPENYQEHMELITAHGFDEADARMRFESGETIFEAYHDSALRDGCLRLQVFENDYTRRIWNHTTLSSEGRRQFLEDVDMGRTGLPFEFRNPQYYTWAGGGKKNCIIAGFSSAAPYCYESGRLNLQIFNGKAYVLSYAAHHAQTRWDMIKSTDEGAVRERLQDMNMAGEKLPDPVELEMDAAVLRISGKETTIRGKSEPGADVTAMCFGGEVNVRVEEDGSFEVDVTFSEDGDYTVELLASRDDRSDVSVTLPVRVVFGACPLIIEEFPFHLEEVGMKTLRGRTYPGAEVFISIGEDEYELYADDEGAFEQVVDLGRYGENTIAMTAVYDGCEDAAAEYTVKLTADEKTMVAQIRSRMKSLPFRTFVREADQHIGEAVSYEARVDQIEYVRGGMKIRASAEDSEGKRHQYIIETEGYMKDYVYDGMLLTMHGEVTGYANMKSEQGKTLMLPSVKADCITFIVIEK